MGKNISRNALCPCGSSERFKKCCGKDNTDFSSHTPSLNNTQFKEPVSRQRKQNLLDAQHKSPDFLRSIFQKAQFTFSQADYEKAIELFFEAHEGFDKLNDFYMLGCCNLKIGHCFRLTHRYEESIEQYLNTQKTYEKSGDFKRILYCNLNITASRNSPQEAIKHYLKLKEKYEKDDEIQKICMCDIVIGGCYEKYHNLVDAIKYFHEAKGRYGKQNDIIKMFQCDICIGSCLQRNMKYDEAIAHFIKGKKQYTELDDNNIVSFCDIQLGQLYFNKQQYEKAIEYYRTANQRYEELGDTRQMAECDRQIGQCYSSKRQYEKAIEYFLKACKRFEELGDTRQMAECVRQIGQCYSSKRQYEKAIEYFLKARKRFEEIGDTWRMAECDRQIGQCYSSNQQYGKAIEYFCKVHLRYEELGDTRQMAGCDRQIAEFYHNNGHYEDAIRHYRTANQRYEELGDTQQMAECDRQIGQCYSSSRQYGEASEYFLKARKRFEELGDTRQMAECDRQIGQCYSSSRQYGEASEYFLKARKSYEEIGDIWQAAQCDIEVGNLCIKTHQPEEANECYLNAHRRYEELGDIRQMAQCNSDIANHYSRNHQYEEAIEHYLKAYTRYKELGDIRMLAQCDNSIGHCYRKNCRYEEAIEHHLKAYTRYKELGDIRNLPQCDNLIGHCYSANRQYGEAIEYYRKARKRYEELGDIVQLAQCDNQIGHCYIRNRNHKDAIESHFEARKGFKKLGDINQIARCASYIGFNYAAIQFFQEAIKHYLLASREGLQAYASTFPKAQQLSLLTFLAECHEQIASLYNSQGYYTKAISWYLLAITSHLLANDVERANECSLKKNNLLKLQNIHVSTKKRFLGWQKIISKEIAQYRETLIKAHFDRITALEYQEQGKYQEAFLLLEGAAPQLALIQDNCYLSLAQLATTLGIHETGSASIAYFSKATNYYFEAESCYRKNYQAMLVEMSHTPGVFPTEGLLSLPEKEDGIILCGLGLAYLSKFLGKDEKYIRIIADLKEEHDQLKTIDSWRNLAWQAKKMVLNGNAQKAKILYEKAILEAEKFWNEELGKFSKASVYRTKFLEENYDIYLDLVQLCVKENESAEALENLERISNKLLTEQLFSSVKNKAVSWPEIHATIADRSDTCLIWLLPLETHTIIFLARPQDKDGPLILPLITNYNRVTLWKDIKSLQQDRTHADIEQSLMKYLPEVCGRLYQDIVAPIIESLDDSIKKLIIVPYGGFRLLPFHASFNIEANGHHHYLIDDYTVQYAPSAHGFKQTLLPTGVSSKWSRYSKHFSSFLDRFFHFKESALVLFANPNDDLDGQVVEKVSETLGSNFKIHHLVAATPKQLQQSANSQRWRKKVTCFHCSSHADESGLMLHSDIAQDQATLFSKKDIAQLDLKDIRLAVLSACMTGKTSLSIIDQDVSLASAFIAGGAKTVIASLWPVPTAFTSLLTEKMYLHLMSGMTKPDALRQAQLWLKNVTGEDREQVAQFVRNFTESQKAEQQCIITPRAENIKDPAHLFNWAGFYCTGADDALIG